MSKMASLVNMTCSKLEVLRLFFARGCISACEDALYSSDGSPNPEVNVAAIGNVLCLNPISIQRISSNSLSYIAD